MGREKRCGLGALRTNEVRSKTWRQVRANQRKRRQGTAPRKPSWVSAERCHVKSSDFHKQGLRRHAWKQHLLRVWKSLNCRAGKGDQTTTKLKLCKEKRKPAGNKLPVFPLPFPVFSIPCFSRFLPSFPFSLARPPPLPLLSSSSSPLPSFLSLVCFLLGTQRFPWDQIPSPLGGTDTAPTSPPLAGSLKFFSRAGPVSYDPQGALEGARMKPGSPLKGLAVKVTCDTSPSQLPCPGKQSQPADLHIWGACSREAGRHSLNTFSVSDAAGEILAHRGHFCQTGWT